jgi:hypothetical protein
MDIDVMQRQLNDLIRFKARVLPMLEEYEKRPAKVVHHRSSSPVQDLHAAEVLRNVRKVADAVHRTQWPPTTRPVAVRSRPHIAR